MRKSLILLCWMLLLAAASLAYAEEKPTPTPLPPNVRFGLGVTDVEVRPVKERLNELGYYDGDINYEVDNDTLFALKHFCEDNSIEYSAYGVTYSAFSALTSSREFVSIATPSPVPEDLEIYETISFGAVSEKVLDIQIRLKELGYYEGLKLTPNTYDWDFQSAIDRFCKENNIAMTDMEITPGLQKILFSGIEFVHLQPETVSVSPTPQPVNLDGHRFVLGESSIEIRRLQDRLTELGFYKQDEYGYELNMDTLYAFNLFCYENRIHYSEAGITQEGWDLIMGDGEVVSITPLPTAVPIELAEYEPIEKDMKGDAVSLLQLRLIELGYASNTQLELGVYDERMADAVRLFCDYNHIAFEGESISTDIQRAVFSENAAHYEVSEYKPGLVEKVRTFLMDKHQVLGIGIAGYILALAGVGVLAVFVLMIVLLLTGKPKSGTEESASAGLQGVSKPRTEMSVHTESQMKLIDFSIRYQGMEKKERVRFAEQLEIGRSSDCGLILADDDKGVSRRHCVLQIRGGNIVLSDVSVNGTFVNDKRYNKMECVVHSGDRIQIGRHLLVIKF